MSVGGRVIVYGKMIRFSHSVFALPFAYAAVAIASLEHEVTVKSILWILVAMVSARSAAMGFNRLVDRELDAANPRTAVRELPRGVISVAATIIFLLISSALFILAASRLNGLALKLAPFALAYVLLYSYTKRFTWACHLFLGAAIGIAPVAGWIGVTGEWSPVGLVLWVLVALWVAGFDIIYGCLDYDFDVDHGVHSVPVKVGLERALRLAKALHVFAIILMIAVFFLAPLHYVYLMGVAVIGCVFAYQHSLVKPNDLSQAGRASLDLNGIVSLSYFGITLLSVLLVKWGVGA